MPPDRPLLLHDGSCTCCGTPDDLIRVSEFGKALCPRCYPEFVRARVEATVRRFRMIPRRARVAVAVSGGHDSVTLLNTLAATRRRLNFDLVAIHINMGLGEYSQRCLEVVGRQCRAAGIALEVDQLQAYGARVEAVGDWPVCAVCGGLRRALMPRLAKRCGAQVLATGHTLDDQLQYMLKNVLSGRPVSPAPVLPATPFAPMKVKPMIQIPDAATEIYCDLLGIETQDEPCPRFIPDTHRLKDVFNLLEKHAPMGKVQFWQVLRKVMRPRPEPEDRDHACPICGEITSMQICPLCRVIEAQKREGA